MAIRNFGSRWTIVAAAIAVFAALSAWVAPPSASAQSVNARNGVAFDGYDTVAYHLDGKPNKGLTEFKHAWMGVEWRFASARHRDLFVAEPEKYAPQFGGFCAYGVAQGYKVKFDPDAFTIVDGKLYVNYDKSVQATWVKDIPGYIKQADAKWPELRDKK